MENSVNYLLLASKTYERLENQLLQEHMNEYVVIRGRKLVGVYNSKDQAKLIATQNYHARTRQAIVVHISPRKEFTSY